MSGGGWYRIMSTHSQDMTKYCMECHTPSPLWYYGDCPWCVMEEREANNAGKRKVKDLRGE